MKNMLHDQSLSGRNKTQTWEKLAIQIISNISNIFALSKLTLSPRVGTPLYGLYRYVLPQRVWFFGCFAHK